MSPKFNAEIRRARSRKLNRNFRPPMVLLSRARGPDMISRKSNIASSGKPNSPPFFHAMAWVEQPDRRRLAFVTLPQDLHSISCFVQKEVVIDGADYFCVKLRTFTPPPYREGDTVGLVVARV